MSAALTVSPVNTRPTLRIAGQRHDIVDRLLQTMVLRENRGGLASLELGFVDWVTRDGGQAGFAFADGAIIKLGAEIVAFGGDTSSARELFRGRITGLECRGSAEGPPLLAVLAEDRLQRARKTRRSRIFENASPADVVRAIAAEHRLTPVVTDLDRPRSDWTQVNQSDLAFLRAVLARVDADLQVVGDELQAGPCSQIRRGEVELRLHDNLLSVEILADLADQTAEVRVAGRDPASGQPVRASASDGPLGVGSGQRASAFLAGALDLSQPETLAHGETTTQAEADLLAQASFVRRARRFVRASGRAMGEPLLRVGTTARLLRVNPLFEGAYAVTAATHRYDIATGSITDFQAESAFFGGRP